MYLPLKDFDLIKSGPVSCTLAAVNNAGEPTEKTFFHHPMLGKYADYFMHVNKKLSVVRCNDELLKKFEKYLDKSYCNPKTERCSHSITVNCFIDDHGDEAFFNVTFVERVPRRFLRENGEADDYTSNVKDNDCGTPRKCAREKIEETLNEARSLFVNRLTQVTNELFSFNIDLTHPVTRRQAKSHIYSICDIGYVKYSAKLSNVQQSQAEKYALDVCVPCPRGSKQVGEKCIFCSTGAFQPYPARRSCSKCPRGSPMAYYGATRQSDCLSTAEEMYSEFPHACYFELMDMIPDDMTKGERSQRRRSRVSSLFKKVLTEMGYNKVQAKQQDKKANLALLNERLNSEQTLRDVKREHKKVKNKISQHEQLLLEKQAMERRQKAKNMKQAKTAKNKYKVGQKYQHYKDTEATGKKHQKKQTQQEAEADKTRQMLAGRRKSQRSRQQSRQQAQ